MQHPPHGYAHPASGPGRGYPPQGPGAVPAGRGDRPPGHGMRKAGRILFWIGLPLFLVVVVAGVVVAVQSFLRVASITDEAVRVDGPTEVVLEEGDTILYYFPSTASDMDRGSGRGGGAGTGSGSDTGSDSGPGGGSDTGSGPTPGSASAGGTCSVEGPDPQRTRTHMSSSFTFEGQSYSSRGGFTAGAAGAYTVTCEESSPGGAGDQGGAVLAPPVNAQGIVSGVFGVLGTVFGGLVFGATALTGMILWIVGARRVRQSARH